MQDILATYMTTIKATKTENTYKTYENVFKHWFPNEVDFSLEYISDKLNGFDCSQNSKALRCTVLKQFLQFATKFQEIKGYGIIQELLSSVTPKKVVAEVVTLEQYKQIIEYLEYKKNYRLKLGIMLMYQNGLRVSEVIGIKTCNYNSQEKSIRILDTKNGNDYKIDITDELNDFIKEHVNFDFDYLLSTRNNKPVSVNTFQREVKKVCDWCGYPKLHCHSFRHGSATYLLDNDVNIFVIKEHLHHKSLQSTQRYLHISKKQIEQVKNLFSNI